MFDFNSIQDVLVQKMNLSGKLSAPMRLLPACLLVVQETKNFSKNEFCSCTLHKISTPGLPNRIYPIDISMVRDSNEIGPSSELEIWFYRKQVHKIVKLFPHSHIVNW